MKTAQVKLSKWENCYDSSWKGFITDASFMHPAKFARGLIERIFDHCLKQGYLKPGDVVGDCFGGVGTGGLVAAYRGLRWVGVELEPKFVDLAQQNFNQHLHKLDQFGRPRPKIVQGDSRNFSEVVAGVVSSPPYADTTRGNNKCGIDWEKTRAKPTSGIRQAPGKSVSQEYGTTEGQIGALTSGEVGAVITSPPYSDIAAGGGGLNTKPARHPGQQSGRNPAAASQSGNWSKDLLRYGKSDGQISQLAGGDVTAVVGSPPWEDNCEGGVHKKKFKDLQGFAERMAKGDGTRNFHPASVEAVKRKCEKDSQRVYGESTGQIGKLSGGSVDAIATSPPYESGLGHGGGKPQARMYAEKKIVSQSTTQYGKGNMGTGETYWSAMNLVYHSCFQVIKPGGVIVLVVKDYVKKAKRVPLCEDTCRLLEHCGFVVIERIHAMLTSSTTHGDLFNGHTVTTKSRKSFFRRLAEKKGSPEINFEEVIIAQRP